MAHSAGPGAAGIDVAELRSILLGLFALVVVLSGIVVANHWFMAKKDAETAAKRMAPQRPIDRLQQATNNLNRVKTLDATRTMLDNISSALNSGDYSQISQVFASVAPETIDETKMLLQSVDYNMQSLRAMETASYKMHTD